MSAEDFISTTDAADRLGITRQRVLQLIEAGRLPAKLFANVYMIRTTDLTLVEDRQPGRPPKAKPEQAAKRGGTIESQTKTTRRLDNSIKRDADNRMAPKKKGGKK
ncbi:MAG: helix-turn-helix domain-containing protein [Pyrinomonadaceae bacterium]